LARTSPTRSPTPSRTEGTTVVTYHVDELEGSRVVSLEEKPAARKFDYSVTGSYFYDIHVVQFTRDLAPSERGDPEIS
jgi:glucose-1-phosphate thymidylyltransferase